MSYRDTLIVLTLIGNFFASSASAQQAIPSGVGQVQIPSVPNQEIKQEVKQEVKPEVKPELPPIPPLTPPAALPVLGCASCGDTTGTCGDFGCAGGPQVKGPKYAVELDYTHSFMWFEPKSSPFPLAVGGMPGAVANTLLSGNNSLGMFNSFGFNLKMWLDQEHVQGLGGGGFITENRARYDSVTGGPGGITIQRPFIDAVTGLPSSLLVASGNPAPGQSFAGSIATVSTARLAGADIHIRRNLFTNSTYRLDLFYGFRYYDLNESFTIYQATGVANQIVKVGNQPALAPTDTVLLRDRSYTRNQFYGGEVGAFASAQSGILFATLTPRIAFGPFHQVSKIEGETQSTNVGQNTALGGLLAAGTGPGNGNINQTAENRFGLAVNVAVQGGIHVTEQLSLSVGYNFLFFNEVARPISQFDSTINTRVVPISNAFGSTSGPAAPRNQLTRESFYAHGATVTIQIAY
ncbi:MAG: BBP7 family outer membrane beta-barrel protein [Gemmataceae bacterium]